MSQDLEDHRAEYEKAVEFAMSARGNYLISQALFLAIHALDSREGTDREDSNLADMRYMEDTVFGLYKETQSLGVLDQLRQETSSHPRFKEAWDLLVEMGGVFDKEACIRLIMGKLDMSEPDAAAIVMDFIEEFHPDEGGDDEGLHHETDPALDSCESRPSPGYEPDPDLDGVKEQA